MSIQNSSTIKIISGAKTSMLPSNDCRCKRL